MTKNTHTHTKQRPFFFPPHNQNSYSFIQVAFISGLSLSFCRHLLLAPPLSISLCSIQCLSSSLLFSHLSLCLCGSDLLCAKKPLQILFHEREKAPNKAEGGGVHCFCSFSPLSCRPCLLLDGHFTCRWDPVHWAELGQTAQRDHPQDLSPPHPQDLPPPPPPAQGAVTSVVAAAWSNGTKRWSHTRSPSVSIFATCYKWLSDGLPPVARALDSLSSRSRRRRAAATFEMSWISFYPV